MRLQVNFLFVILFIFTLTVSCKKENSEPDPTPTPTPSKSELIRDKNWMITAITLNQAYYDSSLGMSVTDIYGAYYEPCDKDDYWKFVSTGQLIEYTGTSKCDTAEPPAYTNHTWLLNSAQTNILFSLDYGTFNVEYDAQIVQLDANVMKLAIDSIDPGDGILRTETFTYIKI